MPPPPLLRGEHAAPSPSTRVTEDTPPDLLEGTMDLDVTLPSGIKVLMNVHRSTPMMDLLIQVTTAHGINPGGHVIHVFSDRRYVTYKPSTPIGTLDTNAIEIVPKNRLKEAAKAKKAALHQQAVERNIRLKPKEWVFKQQLVVNLPGNQLGVFRVPPSTLISDIHSLVCRDKGLDLDAYEIRHPVNVDERLRSSCSLSDYQLQEVTLVPKDFRPPPLSVSDLITMASIAHQQQQQQQQQQEDRKRPPRGIRGLFTRKVKSSTGDSSLSSGSAGDRSLSPARSDESVEGKAATRANAGNGHTSTSTTILSTSSSTLKTAPFRLSQNRSLSANTLNSAGTTGATTSRPSSVVGLPRAKKRQAPTPPQFSSPETKTTTKQTTHQSFEMDEEEKENRSLSRHSSGSSAGKREDAALDDSASCSVGSPSRGSAPLHRTNLTTTSSNSSLSLSSSRGKRKAPQPPLVKQSHVCIPEEGERADLARSPSSSSSAAGSQRGPPTPVERGPESLSGSSITSDSAAVSAALAAMEEAADHGDPNSEGEHLPRSAAMLERGSPPRAHSPLRPHSPEAASSQSDSQGAALSPVFPLGSLQASSTPTRPEEGARSPSPFIGAPPLASPERFSSSSHEDEEDDLDPHQEVESQGRPVEDARESPVERGSDGPPAFQSKSSESDCHSLGDSAEGIDLYHRPGGSPPPRAVAESSAPSPQLDVGLRPPTPPPPAASFPDPNDVAQERTGSLSSAASGSSIERTNDEDFSFPSSLAHNGGPESAYDSMSDAPREGSSKSDSNSPLTSPDSTLSKDISASSSTSTAGLKKVDRVYDAENRLIDASTGVDERDALVPENGPISGGRSKIVIEYSCLGESSTDDPPNQVLNSGVENSPLNADSSKSQQTSSSVLNGNLPNRSNEDSVGETPEDFICKQNVINELKSTVAQEPDAKEPKILNLRPKSKEWFDSKSSNYTLILSMDSKSHPTQLAPMNRSPSDESISSYSSADDAPKIRTKSSSTVRTSRTSTVSSYESAPPPIPDSCIPESDFEDDAQSLSSGVSASSNSLDRRPMRLSRESSSSDLGVKGREDPYAARPRLPLFSIATYKNRAEEISYDKRLVRSESFHGVKKTRSVTSLHEVSAADDSRKFTYPPRFGRNESLRDVSFKHDPYPSFLREKNRAGVGGQTPPASHASRPQPLPLPQSWAADPELKSPPSQSPTPPPIPPKTNPPEESPVEGAKQKLGLDEVKRRPRATNQQRPASTALDFKIGVYESRPMAPPRRTKHDPHKFLPTSQPSAFNPNNLKKTAFTSPMRKSRSTIDIRGSGDPQFPEGVFQQNAAPDSGLAQEYLKLQEDFMKWQQQLLQNQHVLHSRVAPIAAQPPTMNNMGVFKDMLNHSSQPMGNMPPSQAPQAPGPRRPVEINIPIRFEGDDDVTDSSSTRGPQTISQNPPRSSRWNNTGGGVPVTSWQDRPPSNTTSSAPQEKREFIIVTDPPQVFQAPSDPGFAPIFQGGQQQQPKARSPQPRGNQWVQPQPPQSGFSGPAPPSYSPQQGGHPGGQSAPQSFHPSAQPTYPSGVSAGGASPSQFVDDTAARQAFWRSTQDQRPPGAPAPDTLQRQTSPFQTAERRQQIPSRSPEAAPTPPSSLADDNVNARFTSVVTLNDRGGGQDANRDKVRSIVQLNNVDGGGDPRPPAPTTTTTIMNAPTVRGFKLPQENQSVPFQQQPPVDQPPTPTTVHNARARPWSNRSSSGDRQPPSQQQQPPATRSYSPGGGGSALAESAAPMSSRLVQAVQQPPPTTGGAPSPSRVSPAKRPVERKSPSPAKSEPSPPPHPAFANVSLRPVEQRASPPKSYQSLSSAAAAAAPIPYDRLVRDDEPAGPPAPPPPPPSAPGPPPPPPPPMKLPTERRTSTGKKIISSQQEPELDARAELMMAIRQFGGAENLRRKNVNS